MGPNRRHYYENLQGSWLLRYKSLKHKLYFYLFFFCSGFQWYQSQKNGLLSQKTRKTLVSQLVWIQIPIQILLWVLKIQTHVGFSLNFLCN